MLKNDLYFRGFVKIILLHVKESIAAIYLETKRECVYFRKVSWFFPEFSSVSSESFSDRLSVIGSLAPHTAGPPFCVTHEEQKGKHRHTVDSSHTDAQGWPSLACAFVCSRGWQVRLSFALYFKSLMWSDLKRRWYSNMSSVWVHLQKSK